MFLLPKSNCKRQFEIDTENAIIVRSFQLVCLFVSISFFSFQEYSLETTFDSKGYMYIHEHLID